MAKSIGKGVLAAERAQRKLAHKAQVLQMAYTNNSRGLKPGHRTRNGVVGSNGHLYRSNDTFHAH